MRSILASLMVLLTTLATLATTPLVDAANPAAPEPCHSGFGYDWCTVDIVVCRGEVRLYHGQPVTEAGLACPGVTDCFVQLVGLQPSVATCTFPTAARSDEPVECWDGINGDGWCGVHVLGCTVGRGYTSDPKHDEWIDAGCSGVFDCRIDYNGVGLEHVECGFPTAAAAAPLPYGCEPTPHGLRCEGDLLVCTTYSGSETNGLSYLGFDCGVLGCDFLFLDGRLKSWNCA